MSRNLISWLFPFLVLWSCSGAPPPVAPPPEKPAAEAGSVKPGINDPYFKDPNAENWTGKFEIESREIFTERERIVDAAGVESGMHIADIGAGTGFLTLLLARRTGPKGLAYAVDIIPNFLEFIAKRAESERIFNVCTVLGREKDPGLAAGSIDLAFACDSYHHFEYPEAMLAHLHRALRSGGRLVIVDFIRIPGQSRPWILDHVRAGEEVVTAEITAAGFEKISEARFLKENYILVFRRRS